MPSARLSQSKPDLDELVSLFFERREELGAFRQAEPVVVPDQPRMLLDHDDHMTVTVEAFHQSPVRVDVLQTLMTDRHYARKILLRRTSDDVVVQFGIVRLDLWQLSEPVQQQIKSQQTPLGRILISNDVMRKVECVALWEVTPAESLREFFACDSEDLAYGRTALIHCNGEPAVELLEIVAPNQP